mgnify:CR=1 FL=1
MRCFIAIELPEAIRSRLRGLQDHLNGLSPIVRWTRPEQIHLTIKFLGEVPDDRIAQVCSTTVEVAAAHAAFRLQVRGAGCFPPYGNPRVLWAGLHEPPDNLLRLHRDLDAALARLGYPPENRAFSPHLTIGRVREGRSAHGVRPAVQACAAFGTEPFAVTELIVFQSILRGGQSPVYVPLARAPLA